MAIARHLKFGSTTYDLPSGEAFSIRLSATLAQIAAGGNFSLSGVKTADVKAAIAAKKPIVFTYDDGGGGGIASLYGEILITNLGDTGGSGLALTNGTIVLMNGSTLKIMKVVFSGGATNVTSVTLTDVTPQSGAANLYDLQDVSIFNLQNGDVLTYDNNSGTWINLPAGGGGGEQLPVIIDVGRIIHQNGVPQHTIADVPQGNIVIPFDRQVMFSYRAFESGFYNMYWTNMPDAYKIGLIDQYGTVMGNAEDLHWIVNDIINNQGLPLTQDIEYRLMMYKVVQGQTYLIEIPLWLSTSTTSTEIAFYLDSTGFNVRQVQYIGADT